MLLTLLGVAGAASAATQDGAPDARLARVGSLRAEHKPAGVPSSYVMTPFGSFAPECVHHLGNGERILDDGGIQRADGRREQPLLCTQDNFTPDGIRVRPDGRGVEGQLVRSVAVPAAARRQSVEKPIDSGWIQASGYTTGVPIGRIVASWKVPPSPSNAADQTVYFFPGLVGETILQPVLGYRGYNNSWDLSSWNCCKDGTVWLSDSISAKPGDQIVGDTYSTCAAGVVCSKWNIDTHNVTSGQSVRLTSVPYGNTDQVVGGALEVYSVDSCDQYPSSGTITFSDIAVYDRNFNRVTSPPWESISDSSDISPQCNYAVDTTATSATISY
ncbi:hypothetical protein FZ025_14455 [Xanthomonas hyacinthi]|uniref:Uncharacterized protein n=1 Tax=Xanthomonas hyacinthi TaxID=56455 RepID=A0A2S7F0R3_9XANT|nr:hypothetical protein [Xanthomonas hyacinthi]PPU98952.1 hypothetical protein XhyaCFBP1156_06140 [Xanthomonas hyacinthi]QGY77789.1 hypothetical protein FZ025_14455 [Xanthomonas hyacinthi]